jgi:cyclopropane-fatty-acyl-phospholipid synthase
VSDRPRRRAGPALATRLVRRMLPRITAGSLSIGLPNGDTIDLRGCAAGPDAVMTIRRWRALLRLATEGYLGFARAHMDGDCTTPDIKTLMDLGACNEDTLGAANGILLFRLLARLHHRFRANTRTGSRRNIAAHYDLGNEFYGAWLDRGMKYSSGLYTTPDQTLEQAQDANLDRTTEMLDLTAGARVLEIGCGWGALAERILSNQACTLTGLTLSTEQLQWAQDRLAAAGLDARADLRLQDYRDVAGRFDRIVSIEMLEAVGTRYWPTYFEKVRSCLNPGGSAILQVITIDERRYDDYVRTPDFIQQYIFPGGMLPTKASIERHAAAADLTLVDQQMFGASYARTLEAWRWRFLRAWPAIEALGFDTGFKRMWEHYLVYCQVGFEVGAIDVGLYKFAA